MGSTSADIHFTEAGVKEWTTPALSACSVLGSVPLERHGGLPSARIYHWDMRGFLINRGYGKGAWIGRIDWETAGIRTANVTAPNCADLRAGCLSCAHCQ